MSQPLKSQQDLYQLFIDTLQNRAPELTDVLDGSIIDGLAGVFSVAGMELQRYNLLQFNKTFIDLANGPEITGGDDDLQTLAVDHFGDAFERPGAVAAIDTATFTRPTNAAGEITILAGSIVKTPPDANGESQRYSTDETVILTASSGGADLTVSVGITAVVEGSDGDATEGTINVIETSLLDTTIVVTNAGNSTGEDAQDDATYRETIRNLIVSLRAATRAAIEAVAKTVSGVVIATAVEIEQPIVLWNPVTNLPLNPAVLGIYEYLYLPYVTLYIADDTGTASDALVAAVIAAIDPIRAYGVHINVEAASPVTVDWSLQITLNPSGPNYITFSANTTEIVQSMSRYIGTLGTGVDFVRATAEAEILAIWGAAGTNDLTAVHTTVPTGDVAIGATENAIPGTIETV